MAGGRKGLTLLLTGTVATAKDRAKQEPGICLTVRYLTIWLHISCLDRGSWRAGCC